MDIWEGNSAGVCFVEGPRPATRAFSNALGMQNAVLATGNEH